MNNIFCIIGKTSSGKSYFFKRILQNDDFMENFYLKKIPTYTNRPLRNEKEKEEYIVIEKEKFLEMINNNEFASYIKFDTVYGEWYYGHTRKMFETCKNPILIVSPEEAIQLKEIYKNKVIIICMMEEPEERILRLLKRQDNLKLEEKIRRLEKEKIEFKKAFSLLDIDFFIKSGKDLETFKEELIFYLENPDIDEKGV